MSKQIVTNIVAKIVDETRTKSIYDRSRSELDKLGDNVVTIYKKNLSNYSKFIDVNKVWAAIITRISTDFSEDNISIKSGSITVTILASEDNKLRRAVTESILGRPIRAEDTTGTEEQVSFSYNKNTANDAYKNRVYNTLEEISWAWYSTEKISSSSYLKNIRIEGTSSSSHLSPRKRDLLLNKFQKEFANKAKSSKVTNRFVTESASPSPLDKIKNNILYQIWSKVKRFGKANFVSKKPKASTSSSRLSTKTKTRDSRGARANITVKESPINLKALIPQINMKLHDQIKRNMGSPALNYRTGRFAHSAHVLDIQQTPKGFPSIHYTYQRDPYSLFEYPGGSPRLATPQRDPRKIIGTSIRELASELIEGRFYTKRL
jgi:hypothetical protein